MKWNKYLTIASLGNLITVGIVFWALYPLVYFSDCGFDLTDEGIALTCSQFPNELLATTSAYFDYSHVVFSLLNYNVGYLRIWGIFVLIGSGVVMGIGISQWLKAESRMKDIPVISIVGLSIMGALFYYCYWLNVPTYNLYNAAAVTAGLGLVFLALVPVLGRPVLIARDYGYFFLAGMVAGLDFFLKFPSAISSLLLYGFLLAVVPLASFRIKLKAGLVILAGVVVWFLVHFVFFKSPAALFISTYNGYLGLEQLGHTGALGHYGNDMWTVVVKAAVDYWPLFLVVGVGFALAELARRYWFNPRIALVILIIATLGAVLPLSYHYELMLGGINFSTDYMALDTVWFFLLSWITLLSVVYFRNEIWPWSSWRHLLLGGFAAGSATFAGAAGTGNNIYIDTVFNLGPWFAMLALMLLVIARLHSQSLIYFAGVITLAYLTAYQLNTGVFRPYGLTGSYYIQTVPTDVGFPVTQLKLDAATSKFCNDLRKLCYDNGFRPGDDVFPFYALPGLTYILGGKTPGTPWFFGHGVYGGPGYDDVYLSMVSPDRMKKAFIIEDETCTDSFPNLHKYGVNFPEDFILCGTLTLPFTKQVIKVWKPK